MVTSILVKKGARDEVRVENPVDLMQAIEMLVEGTQEAWQQCQEVWGGDPTAGAFWAAAAEHLQKANNILAKVWEDL